MSRQVSLILGKALLWGLMDNDFSPFLESRVWTDVFTAYAALGGRYKKERTL